MVKPFQPFNSWLLIRANYPRSWMDTAADHREMEPSLYWTVGSCVRQTSRVFLFETTTLSITYDTLRLQANHARQCKPPPASKQADSAFSASCAVISLPNRNHCSHLATLIPHVLTFLFHNLHQSLPAFWGFSFLFTSSATFHSTICRSR